jgi:hypothetical protein
LETLAGAFVADPARTFAQVVQHTNLPGPKVAAGLNRLALLGQVIHDLPAGLYRWRQVMPTPLTLTQIGPENPETVGARELLERGKVTVTRNETTPSGLKLLAGRLPGHDVELLMDADGRIMRGKCNCSHHYKSGLRRGPCQHLQALRNKAVGVDKPGTLDKWFSQYWTT